ncbi:MAG: leucyl aminopeptidase [Pseudomonadota bacterium]
MAMRPKIDFKPLKTPSKGVCVVLASVVDDLPQLAATAAEHADKIRFSEAAAAAEFSGKSGSLTLWAPSDTGLEAIVALAAPAQHDGDEENHDADQLGRHQQIADFGGRLWAAVSSQSAPVTVLFEQLGVDLDADDAAALAQGIVLRSYKFDKYKTKPSKLAKSGKGSADKDSGPKVVTIACADPAAAKKAAKQALAVADGVMLARELVNMPANDLGPAEFAAHAEALTKLGVEVEVLGEKQMAKLGMRALLGVGEGSERESKLAIMRWRGTKAKGTKPIAFVGKGVVFDTGGISIKPSGGMEDMKGDMAGAACVVGLMHALAGRKAKVDAIGVIGLVENMPDGRAQRPGDIVTAMSGATIEIINTDAEGRLVLADALHYTIDRFKPEWVVNLATLTGAVIVALGHHHAGLFSNNDELAEGLGKAGVTSGEKLWRLPLGKPYDKLIDSRFADMKNSGGRWAGSITAAQFLQRFVGDTPWAHLDIAGTGMSSPKSDTNTGWASGFGVRLLDQYVRDRSEQG